MSVHALFAHAGFNGDRLSGIENVAGSIFADTLLGSGAANVLEGGGGNDSLSGSLGNDTLLGGTGADSLYGGIGADSLNGGTGNDIYVVTSTGDLVFETATMLVTTDAGGIDTVQSAVSFSLDASDGVRFVENLLLTGNKGITGTGNALANQITGNLGNNALNGGLGNNTLTGGAGNDSLDGGDGNDVLDGGLGRDTMIGGFGNDTYAVDKMGDVVIEVAGGGRDTVQTMLTSYQLGAEVEKLVDFGTRAFTGTGNVLSNTIIGNIGNDTLSGLDGNDTMTGGQGDDVFVFNTAISATNHDTITDFKLGDDTIRLENTGAGLFNALPTGVLAASAFKLIGPGGAPQMPTTESSTNNPPNNCSTTRTALALEPPSSSLTCPICRSSTKLISS